MINSILGDPRTAEEFKIRGITRDPSKPNAKALINRGVEFIEVSIKLCFLKKNLRSSSICRTFPFFLKKKKKRLDTREETWNFWRNVDVV